MQTFLIDVIMNLEFGFSPPAFCFSAFSFLIFYQCGVPPWCFFFLPETTLTFMGATVSIIFIDLELRQRWWGCKILHEKCTRVFVDIAFSDYLCCNFTGVSGDGHLQRIKGPHSRIAIRKITDAICSVTFSLFLYCIIINKNI